MIHLPHSKRIRDGRIYMVIATCIILVVAFLGLCLARGWIRNTVFPAIAPTFARHSLDTAMREGAASVRVAGAMTESGSTSSQARKCSLDNAEGLHMTADCESYVRTALPAGAQSDTGLSRSVEQLKASGWNVTEFDTPSETYDRAQVYALRDYDSAHCVLILVATPSGGSAGNAQYKGISSLHCDYLVSIF